MAATNDSLLASALARAANAIFIADSDGRIVWVNRAFSVMTGYSATEAIGRTPNFLKSGQQGMAFYEKLWQCILAGGTWHGEIVERHKDGSYFTVEEIITPLFGEDGAITHFIAIQHDITQLWRELDRNYYLANHDALTGLPNRMRFFSALKETIAQAERHGRMFALLFLDLDKFKPINDALGHHVGDLLLVNLAKRLNASVRDVDMVARLGGDEFAIVMTDIPDADAAAALARKLVLDVSEPFMLENHSASLTASIGIALYPRDGKDADSLLNRADRAMYLAKQSGKNRYQFFDPNICETVAA